MLRYVAVVVMMLFSIPVRAIPVADVPNPFSTPNVFVADHGQVLGPDYGALITAISLQLRDKTGVELVVVTVDNLDGLTDNDYAGQLFKRLGIGEKGKDNGVLILLSRDDRRVRVEVGYGLESVLNDAKAGRLLDEHGVSYLHKNEFGRGLYESAKAVAFTLADAAQTPLVINDPDPWPKSGDVAPKMDKTRIVMQVAVMLTTVLTGLAIIAKLFMFVRRKTRDGRRVAMSEFNGMTSTVVILGPAATIMVGYSEGVFWTGLLFAVMPLTVGMLVVLGFRKWAQRISRWAPKCGSCHGMMTYQNTSTAELKEEGGKKVRIAERHERWKCSKCGVDKTLVDRVYMGKRSRSGWSYSRPSSRGGRSGGGSSGGGGASRGF